MGLLKFLEDYAAEKAGYIPPDQRREPDHPEPDTDMIHETTTDRSSRTNDPVSPAPTTAADDQSPKLVPSFEIGESPDAEESTPESPPELSELLQADLEESNPETPLPEAVSPISNVNRFGGLNTQTVNQAMENLRAAMESAKAISGERAQLQKELDDLAKKDEALTLREKSVYAKITQHQITINRHLNSLNPNDK